MKLLVALVTLGSSLLIWSDANAADKIVEVPLKSAQGKEIGKAMLREVKDGVKFNVTVSGIAPGKHGLHVHAKGVCEGPDFKTAGDHYSPDKATHGLRSDKGPHAGDLPNIFVKKNGRGKLETVNKHVKLDELEGTALIVHEKADDMKTDPSGNSGGRIACGVISPAPSGDQTTGNL